MAQKDKEKWEKKYIQKPQLLEDRKPSEKLVVFSKLAKGINALEIACGSGRNSIYLSKQGFNVEAFDISQIAIENLRNKNFENLIAKQKDLENFIPKENSYDFIVKTNYLDRKLIPHLAKALKKDGLLLIETYMNHKDNTKPIGNPDFLLKASELKSFFNESIYEIIEYDEFDNEPEELYKMKKQSIVIRKIS